MKKVEVTRLISTYDKKSHELLNEYNIDFIGVEVLKELFNPPTDDPLMYNFYWIEDAQLERMKQLVDIEFDLEKYIYQVECFQAGT